MFTKIDYYNSLKEIFNESIDKQYLEKIILLTSIFPSFVRYFFIKPIVTKLAASGDCANLKKIVELATSFENIPGGKSLVLKKAIKVLMMGGDKVSIKKAFLLIKNNMVVFTHRDIHWLEKIRDYLLRLEDKDSLESAVKIACSFNHSIQKFNWFEPLIKLFVTLKDKENLEKIAALLAPNISSIS